jgi:hypothetical protein
MVTLLLLPLYYCHPAGKKNTDKDECSSIYMFSSAALAPTPPQRSNINLCQPTVTPRNHKNQLPDHLKREREENENSN